MKQLLIIVLLFSTAQIFAQDNDGFTRKGFVFGLGVGGGIIHVQDHNTEAGFEKMELYKIKDGNSMRWVELEGP